jgi:putative DNA base modification enzyme with NMAD domain
MALFSYKLTDDAGFAPNPFWGALTLATCKPAMRRSKTKGAWIAGFTSDRLCGDRPGCERLVYLMQVTEKLSIADYFREPTFANKIPIDSRHNHVVTVGDNIYQPLSAHPIDPSGYRQIWNRSHWDEAGTCSPKPIKRHDISGEFVLISTRFVYFGRSALDVPSDLRPSVPLGQSSQGHVTKDAFRAGRFIEYAFERAHGVQVVGPPHSWPAEDVSWKQPVGRMP